MSKSNSGNHDEEERHRLKAEITEKLPNLDEQTAKMWVLAMLKYGTEFPVIKTVDMFKALDELLNIKAKVDKIQEEEDKQASEEIRKKLIL